jgi:signal transduction histidine kinase
MNQNKDAPYILLVESDVELLAKLEAFLTEKGFFVKAFGSTERSEIVEFLILQNVGVVILDIDATNFDLEVFRTLRKISIESQFILHSNHISDEFRHAIEIGLIYSYVPKLNNETFLLTNVQSALDSYKNLKQINSKLRLENQDFKRELEWLLWQQRSNQNNKYNIGKMIIETLSHTIFQGMGIGATISLIEILDMSRETEGEYTRVKTDLLEEVLKNVEPIGLIKERLDQLIELFEKDYGQETITSEEYLQIISENIKAVDVFRKIKNQKISFNKFHFPEILTGNREFLDLAIQELLINAFKYSTENSRIYITRGFSTEGFSLIIMNTILEVSMGIKGIPTEYENEIFEPFFRLNKIYDERYYQEKMGFGIGLSVIQKGVQQLGGNIFVYETNDFATSSVPSKKIVSELILPYKDKQK